MAFAAAAGPSAASCSSSVRDRLIERLERDSERLTDFDAVRSLALSALAASAQTPTSLCRRRREKKEQEITITGIKEELVGMIGNLQNLDRRFEF